MTSNVSSRSLLLKTQKEILALVKDRYPQVYLVGGTAISLLYRHRVSEDVDFFTQHYTRKFHREIASYIRGETGYAFSLIEEETRKRYVNMAVYEFQIGRESVLKVDLVADFVELLRPRRKDGVASIEDIYYRKILAAIGWKEAKSGVGRVLPGGRQKAKDLYDIFFLSDRVEPLSTWFPKYFDRNAYERLAAWHLGISKQRTIPELMELVPGCDTKAVFKELDSEIIHKLNKFYFDYEA